ncbi:Uncharacterized protein TCM_033251 [Theobroma cacao]|uniref:Uncharacterized protein n=1 Tax=Theobroma cacao TaxID=3641 RepID=A0A061FAY4_THECC|nr:Uncharacterized protein TCM_033251 [Theobroma cacao]
MPLNYVLIDLHLSIDCSNLSIDCALALFLFLHVWPFIDRFMNLSIVSRPLCFIELSSGHLLIDEAIY